LSGAPEAYYVNKSGFFGSSGVQQPDKVRSPQPSDSLTSLLPDSMPYCMVLRRDLHLEPGERRKLRYAYGTVRPGESLTFLNGLSPQPLAAWKDNLVYFSTGEDPVLQREIAWHAYNLASATVYSDFHRTHLVPQGSAYLFLHGADGALRDQALFTLPMTYMNPDIARDMLRLIMRVTDAQSGQISYAFAGHGFLTDGMGIHTQPSDLDLFFLLGLCEYLSATGDLAFLDENVPFYPPDAQPSNGGTTVLDHVRVAVRHLFEEIGTGEHGLIRVGSGDWSDSIVLETALRDGVGPFGVTHMNSKHKGESVPNTQMALYVLPLLASIIENRDPDLVAGIQARLIPLHEAVDRQWNANGWYNRAILRDVHDTPKIIDHLDLEAQVWALIGGLAGENESTLIETIEAQLDRPSPIGASLTVGGMVWPAISQLLTWGYARSRRPALAWRSLNRNTFAMHSTVYPDVWFNTWSGPDGINGLASDTPGGTWSSLITPMTDFPVMNANQDAMALLGLLRVCGVEPMGDGLRIAPVVPRSRFTLETPLLRLHVAPGLIAVDYHPIVTGSRIFRVEIPAHAATVTLSLNGQPLSEFERDGTTIIVPIQFVQNQTVRFEIRWT
jgi:hypothetical protein